MSRHPGKFDPLNDAVPVAPVVDLDARLPTPLYHQIYSVIRDKILSGAWPDDMLVPSEVSLAEHFGVSRITVRRALDDLASEGLLVRRRGSGTRVRHALPARPVRVNLDGMLETLQAMGRESAVRLLAFDYGPPPPHVREALGMAADEEAQRAVRVRSIDGKPFSHLVTYVPAAIGRRFTRKDLAATPLLTLLERSGIVVSRARQAISATLADPDLAGALGIQVGAPLLVLTRSVFDQGGRGVEHITAHYRPDRYQYRMDLSRVGNGAEANWSPAESSKPFQTTSNRKQGATP